MITKTQLIKKVAYLEFLNDQLSAELTYVDELLRAVGFPEGLKSAKEVAYKILEEENFNDS